MVCPPQAALNSGANLVFTPQPHRARHSRAAGSCNDPFSVVQTFAHQAAVLSSWPTLSTAVTGASLNYMLSYCADVILIHSIS